MTSYQFLLDLAIILLSTKLLGLLAKKIQMPQVIGALLAGIILGPAVFDIVKRTDFLSKAAEIGVIILMFTAGLQTDLKKMKKCGKASLIIAAIGVIVPLMGGYLVAALFNTDKLPDVNCSLFLQNVFIGVVLTATSVSITVETLREIGALNTRAGNAILGAAVIDDVFGIVCLTIVTGAADPSVNIGIVLLKIIAFFLLSIIAGYAFREFFRRMSEKDNKNRRRYIITAFAFCLIFSYIAEDLFGVTDITGAYIAGLFLSGTSQTNYITNRLDTLSYSFFSPIFFASIGLEVIVPPMTSSILCFSLLLIAVAVLSKVIGCGIGAKLCKYSNKESLQIGIGMISRGEVALIVANRGLALKMMSSVFLGPVILTVIISTILTPMLLRFTFHNDPSQR